MDFWQDEQGEDDGDELKDFTYSGKDALLFLIDATPSMLVRSEDDISPFEKALRCVQATLKTKIFGSPGDYVGVLLFGTREKVGIRDFDNLSLFLPFDIPEGKSILKIDEYLIEHPIRFESDFGSSDKFNLHEALWQSQTLFNDVPGKAAYKKIILFTSNDDPHNGHDNLKKQSTKKAGDLGENHIELELIPVGNDHFDVDKFYVDLLPEDSNVEVAAGQKLEDLLTVVKKRVYKKRSLARLKWDLGGGVHLAVSMYSFVQKATKPTKRRLTRDTNEEVKIQRQFINSSTGAPLLPSDINKYQEYGGKKIKFTLDETKSLMSMDGHVGLRLLCFKDRNELRLHHFVRHCNFIYPDENVIKGSRNIFAALLIQCDKRNVIAICSFKAREGTQPNFVALVPHAEKQENGEWAPKKGFLIFYLPFHDDIRTIPEIGFESTKEEELETVKKILNKLKLKNFEPEAFENPVLQSHFRLIEGLALQEDELPEHQDLTAPPVDKMDKKLGQLAEQFNSTFVKGMDLVVSGGSKSSKGPPKAKAVKVSDDNASSVDIREYVRNKTLDKLKVPDLKQAVMALGITVTGKKKQDLIDDLYKNFKV